MGSDRKLQIKKIEIENQKSGFISLLGMFQGFQNCLCFFLAQMVSDFYSFEVYGKKIIKTINCRFSQKPWPKLKKVLNKTVFIFNSTSRYQISAKSVHK